MTTPGGGAPDGAYVIGGGEWRYGQNLTEASAKTIMKGGTLSSFENAQGVAHGTYNDKIDDHSQSITELQDVINTLILQGEALKYVSNGSYTPNPNVVSVEVISIGAGGGGSSGSYDGLGGHVYTGGGGGGGGETHASIPASLLPVDGGGAFKTLQVIIGAGGNGALSDSDVGTGGGHTLFGPEVASADPAYLLGGGGQGGAWGISSPQAQGGAGMIPGGNGSPAIHTSGGSSTGGGPGGNSTSAFSLNGGGGGGGCGASLNSGGSAGGSGAISPGGAAGTPGNTGTSPADIIATGGGGGGGGSSGNAGGGDGGYPAGGGGGSACHNTGATFGGDGADGVMYIIERMA